MKSLARRGKLVYNDYNNIERKSKLGDEEVNVQHLNTSKLFIFRTQKLMLMFFQIGGQEDEKA